ncbi:hypothetical protein BGZ60DRAFT_401267 [Tricladium varicosporioides]|nr:hypothetical protein BGZ60DRAFT_401267 [Hymenoscyphus varicosporioides]
MKSISLELISTMLGMHGKETIQARRHRQSLVPRACEGCKIRKIRCDRSSPCSNCQTSGIACQDTSSRLESRPKPDKVTKLEEHIERLEQRLCHIEHQLMSQSIASEHPRIPPVSDKITAENERAVSHLTTTATLYEGSSSFTNQSVQASEVAQRAANSEGAGEGSSLDVSFSYLETLLRPTSTFSSLEDYSFSRNPASRFIPTVVPLPVGLVVAILQKIKERPPVFLSSYAVNDLSLIESLCQKVYFPTKPISLGHVTGMHGILYFLLKEYITMQDPLCGEYDLKAHLAKCEQNFNAGIEAYDVLAVPSFENILALTMGVIKAQDDGKPLLCCTLISAAASHCQTLGYHREMMYQNDRSGNAENVRRLFWTIYVFDKNMSLLFGRASNIQDFEIDGQYPVHSADPALRPWDESFIMGIKLAKLQGRIYDRLYSAAVLKITTSERMECINELETALQQWHAELEQIDSSQVSHYQIFKLSRDGCEIIYYSTLTSLLRASSAFRTGAEISWRCFQAARLSLQSHLRCFSSYQRSGIQKDTDYANWVLLYQSFTPFVVIFLHAIAATSLEDVQLLDDIVGTLQNFRGTSQRSERLYQICATFARLARALTETRNSCVGAYNSQEDSLRLFPSVGQVSIFQPESLQNSLESDMLDPLSHSEAHDISTILSSWATECPSAMDLWGMNFGDGHH